MFRKAPLALTLALLIWCSLPIPAAVPVAISATVRTRAHELHILRELATYKSPLTAEQRWLRSKTATCILWNESTNGKLSANRWQAQGYPWKPGTGLAGNPGSYPPAVQDHYAYVLFTQRGWQPWLADWGVCDI